MQDSDNEDRLPGQVIDEIMELLAPLAFSEDIPDTSKVLLDQKLAELRGFKLAEDFIELVSEQSEVMFGKDGNAKCASIAYLHSELEKWKSTNPFWFEHLR